MADTGLSNDRRDWAEHDRVTAAYAAHAAEIRRFAMGRLRDASGADDVVGECFLRLAIEARAGRFPDRPRGWLYRVALNVIISGARRAATRRAALLSEVIAEPITIESPEALVLASERRGTISRAMEAVGPHGRTGLLMAADGYSGREIAATLCRTEVATRALMWRARASIRKTMLIAEAS